MLGKVGGVAAPDTEAIRLYIHGGRHVPTSLGNPKRGGQPDGVGSGTVSSWKGGGARDIDEDSWA